MKDYRIRKARKRDLNTYLFLRKLATKEYSKIKKRKINLPNNFIKKRFREIISSKNTFLLLVESNTDVAGYLTVSLIKDVNQKMGYVDDIFVLKEFRKKGLGSLLIKEFISILKKKKFKKIRLGAYIDNKKALELYKKLGFKLTHYEFEKRLK